ncbi:MAG: TetR/AcrR family transcriptional regulator [Deltaproteobacteria bacterium]|nr:TetR/AcrR family transcriptional regulator [Deltaproteobacteria bacterium]
MEAAFNIVREQGWEALSQRSIAKKLNASIGPIYSYLKSMTNLEEAVIEKAYELLLHYMLNSRGEKGLSFPSFGYVLFAKNEKKLFKCFFNEKHTETHKKYSQRLWQTTREVVKNHPDYSNLSDRQKEGLHQNIVIFCYGLAILINISFYDEFTDEEISALIADARRMFVDGFKDSC